MGWNQKKFIANINKLIKSDCGNNASEFNKRIAQRDAATKWKKPGAKPSLDALLKISERFNCSLDWLLAGKEPAEVSPNIVIQTTDKLKTFHREFAMDNYIPVRLLADKVAAGSPAEINERDIAGWCLIYADKEWLPHNPNNYTCCQVQGKSMYPILDDGDIVAIDHDEKDPRSLDKKMVAFRKDGGVTIKWLKVLENGLIVGVPENKDNFDSVISLRGEEINKGIVGKVAWWWAKRK